MPNIGPMELIIVLALALLILGPKRLPDAGRSLGRGMREFKDSLSGRTKDEDELMLDPAMEPAVVTSTPVATPVTPVAATNGTKVA